MPSKLSLPPRDRLMPKHIQQKYANGQFDRTGTYGNSAMATHLYGLCPPGSPYCPGA